jgi:hypothetical protein
MREQLVGGERREFRRQTRDVLADRLVQVEFALVRQQDDGRGRKHLGCRAQPEQHFRPDLFAGLDVGEAEPARVDHAAVLDDRDGRARCLSVAQLLESHCFDARNRGLRLRGQPFAARG